MIVQLSLQLTLPTITSDYLVPCGETHLTNSSAKSFIPTPPPPPYLLSASVMSPFHIFTFTSWKQLAVPILRKLKFFWFLSTNLAGVDRGWAQIKRKREMAALAFLSHLPYCTCQAIAFLLVMYHLWIYWYPKLCVSSTLFYVFYTPRKKWYK